MSRVCNIVLVCEGGRDSAFARAFLKQAGIDVRKVTPRENQGGSGHDWVINETVEAIADLGKYAEGRGVLSLLDEDGQDVAKRRSAISAKLKARNLPALSPTDGRCLLLPKRNIETWLYWLRGQRADSAVKVNETDDYKKTAPTSASGRISNEDCGPAGAYLHSLDHTNLPADCPPMLKQELKDLRAFLNALR